MGRLKIALEAESASARLQAAMAAGLRPNDVYIDPLVERFAVEPDFRAVALCDQWGVDGPHQLSVEVLAREREVDWVTGVGDLRRSPSSTPGVLLLPGVRAEFIEASTSDFTTVVEGWLDLPHMPRHIEKVRSAATVAERHLFLVPVDEVLPARFFTNDFPAPTRNPEGFAGLDGVWVWSNYWHQFLSWRDGTWQWLDFPGKDHIDA